MCPPRLAEVRCTKLGGYCNPAFNLHPTTKADGKTPRLICLPINPAGHAPAQPITNGPPTPGQSVFAEVVDKLAPAIESLFIRRLGERIEEMRQAAVADAHERRERQDQNWIKSLIELGVTRDELGISEEDEEENKEQ